MQFENTIKRSAAFTKMSQRPLNDGNVVERRFIYTQVAALKLKFYCLHTQRLEI